MSQTPTPCATCKVMLLLLQPAKHPNDPGTYAFCRDHSETASAMLPNRLQAGAGAEAEDYIWTMLVLMLGMMGTRSFTDAGQGVSLVYQGSLSGPQVCRGHHLRRGSCQDNISLRELLYSSMNSPGTWCFCRRSSQNDAQFLLYCNLAVFVWTGPTRTCMTVMFGIVLYLLVRSVCKTAVTFCSFADFH